MCSRSESHFDVADIENQYIHLVFTCNVYKHLVHYLFGYQTKSGYETTINRLHLGFELCIVKMGKQFNVEYMYSY